MSVLNASTAYQNVYGGMNMYDQTFTLAIDLVNVYHPLRNFSTGTLAGGIVFDAGSTGAVTACASGTGGNVRCTSAAHGLLVGEIVYLTNSTDYDGKYVVTVKDTDWFEVADAYVQDRTFNWYQPSTLKIPAGGAGTYQIWYSLTADGAANTKSFKAEAAFGGVSAITDIDWTATERVFSTGSDYMPLASTGLFTAAAGDYVWLHVKDQTDASDLILRHANVVIRKLD